MNKERVRGQSIIWAVILIVIGTLFLLNNFGLISGFSLYRLLSLWPILLIAIGLDLILGRENRYISYLIATGALVAAFLVAPLLPDEAEFEIFAKSFFLNIAF